MKKSIVLFLTVTLSTALFNISCSREKPNIKNQLYGHVKDVQTQFADSTWHMDAYDKDGDVIFTKEISDDTTITYYNKEGLPEKLIIFGADTIHAISERLNTNQYRFCVDRDSTCFYIYKYNDQQQLIERQTIVNDSLMLQEYFSYENGLLVREETVNEQKERTISTFIYDQHQRLAQECTADGKNILFFHYTDTDHEGNWLKRTYAIDGITYEDSRIITYWN